MNTEPDVTDSSLDVSRDDFANGVELDLDPEVVLDLLDVIEVE